MPKLYLGEAIGLLAKTAPFVWLRLGSYLVLGAALGIYFGVVGGLAWLFGSLWGPLGFIVFLVGVGGAFGVVRWVTRYYFYLLKAAHAAVMTEVVVNGVAPADQIRYGRLQVQERFRDTSILFAVDQLVDGIVERLVRTLTRLGGLIGAWMIKLAVADAHPLAATLLAYHRSTGGMTPNPEWVAKLEGVSDKFNELGRRAVEGMGSGRATGETVLECGREARSHDCERTVSFEPIRDLEGLRAEVEAS